MNIIFHHLYFLVVSSAHPAVFHIILTTTSIITKTMNPMEYSSIPSTKNKIIPKTKNNKATNVYPA